MFNHHAHQIETNARIKKENRKNGSGALGYQNRSGERSGGSGLERTHEPFSVLEWTTTGGEVDGVQYDRDGNFVSLAPITGIAPSPAGKIAKFGKLLSPSNYKAAISNYKQMLVHIRKLRLYKANPFKYDNAGHLMKNAGNPKIQQQIINGRINHLQQEINTFYNNIFKLFN